MTIVFTMTSRMMAIAGACAVLFCVALFLLGMQIGTQYGHPANHLAEATMPSLSTRPANGLLSNSDDPSGKADTNDNAATSTAASPTLSSDTSKP
jgi:hypothetical protein